MLVEVYSDVVCPWCYIGKRRFETALAQFEGRDDVEVVWRPFQLDPDAPATPSPVTDAYARKFGGAAKAAELIGHVTTLAAEDGLDFHLDEAQRSNTFDAHRVIWFARHQGGQDAVKERLLRAYFVEGRDVGDHEALADLAADAGLDRDRVAALLESDEGRADVADEIAQSAELGITAVPTFVFDGQWAVPGAQDPDTMLAVLRKVAAKSAERVSVDAADACADDTCEI